MLSPAIVAAISMIDASALDQTYSLFQRLASITSYLNWAKLAYVFAPAVVIARGEET
jgi:hypothetical protein